METITRNSKVTNLTFLFNFQGLAGQWCRLYLDVENNQYYDYDEDRGYYSEVTKEYALNAAWRTVNNKGGWIKNFAEWDKARKTDSPIPKVLFDKDYMDRKCEQMIKAV